MLQLNVVHLDTRKILFFNNNLYSTHNNFDKQWWQDVLDFTARDRLLIDWLFSYD